MHPTLRRWIASLLGSVAFYTTLPIPASWNLEFHGIARLAPLVGIGIGSLLAGLSIGLATVGMPDLTRGVVLWAVWLVLTGGLHVDGVMDTADGLAVTDPDRRLAVMADSVTGAFGVMAGLGVALLKVAALTDLGSTVGNSLAPVEYLFVLIVVPGWGRWAQLLAILRYPYLRPQGKGAMHKAAIQSRWDLLPAILILLVLAGIHIYFIPSRWYIPLLTAGLGATIATLTGAWFHWRLSGHTGDTYGAVVEWTEALLLGCLTMLPH